MSTAFMGSLLIQNSQKQNWFAFEKMSYVEHHIQEDNCDLLLTPPLWLRMRSRKRTVPSYGCKVFWAEHCLVPMMTSMEFLTQMAQISREGGVGCWSRLAEGKNPRCLLSLEEFPLPCSLFLAGRCAIRCSDRDSWLPHLTHRSKWERISESLWDKILPSCSKTAALSFF